MIKVHERDLFNKAYNIRTDGQIHLGPVNIDAMTPSDLDVAAGHPALHADVKRYAELKKEAVEFRLAGEINKALWLEKKLEMIYDRDIPKSCRW